MIPGSRIKRKKRQRELGPWVWQCGPSPWSGFVLFLRIAEKENLGNVFRSIVYLWEKYSLLMFSDSIGYSLISA